MSLQLLAKQMEAKGRKGDSMLVHMTPGEVAGLQKLAESAGGSLSINPDTGLVEANFLKRMLPTLVGLGVGAATLNPFAGAAAGAAVGGYQARRNDQDVGMGMLMGGLGGYGGASLGMGLGAAGGTAAASTTGASTAAGSGITGGAAPVANMTPTAIAPAPTGSLTADMITGYNPNAIVPDMTMSTVPPPDLATQYGMNTGAAQPATYSENLSQAGRGFGQMGTAEGRAAFGNEFGMTQAAAGAAPLMAPGKAPGEAPIDDEMYSYEYNPGRTGAERSPMAGTSERKYFNSSYSPMRKIKASQYGMAQGGLMSLAAGGTTTAPSGTSSEGMTGASKAAFDYLMGRSEDSGFESQGSGSRGVGGNFGGNDGMYSFDPATGLFTKNPNYVDPEELERQRKAAEAAAEAARQAAAESAAADERRRIEEEEERRRAIPNITPPRQGSIVATPPAPAIPNITPPRQGSIVATPPSGGDYPYQPGDVIPNTPDVYSTPYDMSLLQGTPIDFGFDSSGAYGHDYSGGGYDAASGVDTSYGYGGYFAEGGILGLAKGGDVADAGASNGTSGASKAAFDYLMGKADGSAPQGVAGLRAAPQDAVLSAANQEYIFNPATGAFSKNPNYVDPAATKRSPFSVLRSSLGGLRGVGGGDYADPNPGWTGMPDADKAAYYRENPTMATITQAGQKAAGFTTLGAAQKYAVPDFVERQRAIAQGITPGYSGSSGGFYGAPSDYDGMTQGELAESGGGVGAAAGGLMSLAKGGMKSGGFVVPADVVSMIGEGNTDAGYSRIKSMIPGATAIKGKDGGQADTVKTSIEGKQPARVAHGEMYIPPETVKRMGGAKKLYAMMDRVRHQATGSKKQIKPVSLKRAMA
jgi:hypothetical protein